MPDVNGLDLSRIAANNCIVFTTAYSQYALERYEVNALEYLVKPISFCSLHNRNRKNKNRVIRKEKVPKETFTNVLPEEVNITLKSGTKYFRINIHQIDFVETLGNAIIVHTYKDSIKTRMTIKDIHNVIPSLYLVQIHKSFRVPVRSVFIIESHQITTRRGATLPIGGLYREQIKI